MNSLCTTVSRPNAQQLERVHKQAQFNSASQRDNIVTPSLKLRNSPAHKALPVVPTLNNLEECNNKWDHSLDEYINKQDSTVPHSEGHNTSEIDNQSSDSGSNQTAYANNTQPQTEEQASSHSTASRPNAQQLERVQQQVRSNSASLKQRATLLVRSMWGFRRGEMERTDG